MWTEEYLASYVRMSNFKIWQPQKTCIIKQQWFKPHSPVKLTKARNSTRYNQLM